MSSQRERTFDIDALKDRFKAKKPNQNTAPTNSNYYPFWNIKPGQEAVVRWVPDKNLDNPWFFIDRNRHEFPIQGAVKKVYCLQNWGESCPICDESRSWYSAEGKTSATGKQLYRKKYWIGQIYVVKDPLPRDADTAENSEGKLKYVVLTPQMYDAVEISVEDDLEQPPHHFYEGTNFVIKKTINGEHSDYSRSRFEKHPSALSEDVIDYIESTMVDLQTLLPKKPERDTLEKMMYAYLNGEAYIEDETSQKSTVTSTSEALNATSNKPSPVTHAKTESKPVAVAQNDDDDDDEVNAVIEELKARRLKAAA